MKFCDFYVFIPHICNAKHADELYREKVYIENKGMLIIIISCCLL